MKKRPFLICLLFLLAVEAVTLFFFAVQNTDNAQDAVLVNETVHFVQDDWNTMEHHKARAGLDYVVLDLDGTILFRTKSGLSESINAAVIHRDTILDIQVDGRIAGKIIIYNESMQVFQSWKQTLIVALSMILFIQCGSCIGYFLYLNHIIVKPFQQLKHFAERVAGGNLELPLKMDRQNIFGAFTESFDLMRSELKKARQAEAEANAGKKELVAKLSHDIRTPVASIKAAAEVGEALADNEKTDNEKIRENYTRIIHKTDQINTLITNLFTATLEELKQLSITPGDLESRELKTLLENSDYFHRAVIPPIPDCLLYTDKLRLQQVFDNIFANSYKYADTAIEVEVYRSGNRLAIDIEDYGGVSAEELPLLKEKFKRGNHTKKIEGAGLGLYLSDYFMKEMQGELAIQNGQNGLKVTALIPLSGAL